MRFRDALLLPLGLGIRRALKAAGGGGAAADNEVSAVLLFRSALSGANITALGAELTTFQIGLVDGAYSSALVVDNTVAVDDVVTITVTAKDSYGHTLTFGGATLVGTVTGANVDTIAWVDNADGTYTGTYTPDLDGDDYIAITLNGVLLPDCPLVVTVSDPNLAFWMPLNGNLEELIGNATSIVFDRASPATWFENGVMWTYADDEPRYSTQGYRLLLEGERENECLYSEDMSNAAWTKTNCTVNSTSTVDPYGNASTVIEIEATAANATILQQVIKASESNTYSVCLKEVTVTGAIEITIDGGSTWNATTIHELWDRFERNQTLADPHFGVRIVNSGDIIAMCCNQLEDDALGPQQATSYIGPTTSAPVTRAKDTLYAGGDWDTILPDSAGWVYFELTPYAASPSSYPGGDVFMSFRDTVVSNSFLGGGPASFYIAADSASVSSDKAHAMATGVTSKLAARWSVAAGNMQTAIDGSAGPLSASYTGTLNRTPADRIHVGFGDAGAGLYGWVGNLKGYAVDPGINRLTAQTS